MGRNLTNLYISSSFEFLTQISGSELQNGLGATITGSLLITASKADTATTAVSASYSNVATSASYALVSTSSSFATNATNASTASIATSASYAVSASQAQNAVTASFALNVTPINTGSFVTTASISNATTTFTKADGSTFALTTNNVVNANSASVATSASFATTASFATSASQAVSSSYAFNSTSASFALTASNTPNALITASASGATVTFTKGDGTTFPISVTATAFPYTGSALITGSLGVTGSLSVTGSTGVTVPYGTVITNPSGRVLLISQHAAGPIDTSVAIGQNTLASATGNQNTAVGSYALQGVTSGIGNVGIGASSGFYIEGGDNNTAIGRDSGFQQGSRNASDNVHIGYLSGFGTIGGNNVAVGNGANFPADLLSTGANTFIGKDAGKNFSNGGSSVGVGYFALNSSNGSANTAFGLQAGYQSVGSNNVFLGYTAGQGLTVSDTLIIHNNFNTAPLIRGNFSSRTFIISGSTTLNGNTTISGSLTITGSVTTTGTLTVNNTASADYWMVNTKPFAKLDTNTIVAGRVDGADEDFVLAGRNYAGGTANAITMTDGEFIYNQTIHTFTGSINSDGPLTVNDTIIVTGSLRGNVNALSISSQTASLDCSTGNFFTLTLVSGSTTFVNPSNILPGQTINLRIKQASVASGSISFASSVKQVSGSLYTPTATANAEDIVTFISFDSTNLYLSNIKNFV
jgi:hypothetical protein